MGKSVISFFIGALILVSCGDVSKDETSVTESNSGSSTDSSFTVKFDSLLAKKLGADDYGMRKYVMAFLKKGPNRSQDDSTRNALQRAHLDNITRLAEEGTLVLAGPFFDDGDIRGIYIFAVDSIAQAEKLTNTDPAVQAGSLVMELHEWYGSAAVMKINDIHNQIAKIKI